MARTATSSTYLRGRRRPIAGTVAVTVVVALVLSAGYFLGYRLNLQTGSIPVPTAAASPEEVVHAYVEAYDRRDFDSMQAIYPSGQYGISRFRAMGTMRDLRITHSRSATEADLSGMFPKAGHSYYRVEVTVDYRGLTGSDFSFDDGPNSWTYWLERSTASDPWTIIDHGNG